MACFQETFLVGPQDSGRPSARARPWPVGLTADELDAAGGAACVTAAGVQLVDFGLVLEGEHQALALGDVEVARPFNGQFRHWQSSSPGSAKRHCPPPQLTAWGGQGKG